MFCIHSVLVQFQLTPFSIAKFGKATCFDHVSIGSSPITSKKFSL